MLNTQAQENIKLSLESGSRVVAWIDNLPNVKDDQKVYLDIVNSINGARNINQYKLAARALDGLIGLHENDSRKLDNPGIFYYLRSFVNIQIGTGNTLQGAKDFEKARTLVIEEHRKFGLPGSDPEKYIENYFEPLKNYDMIKGKVGGVPTSEKLESMRDLASKVTLSSFTQEILNYNKKETETVDRASVEIRYVIATLKDRFDKEKPQSSKEQLNLIHEHIHEHFGYRYSPQANVLENITTHSLDCDAVSLLFVEAGKQLGLPIQLRSALVPSGGSFSAKTSSNGKGLHAFVAYVAEDGTDVLTWEPLQKSPELREYQKGSVFIQNKVVFSERDFLSSQYLAAKEIDTALRDYESIEKLSSFPIEKDDPAMLKRNSIYSEALKISPDNIDALVKTGKTDEALEVAEKLGGEVLKEWFQKIIDNPTGNNEEGGIKLIFPKVSTDRK